MINFDFQVALWFWEVNGRLDIDRSTHTQALGGELVLPVAAEWEIDKARLKVWAWCLVTETCLNLVTTIYTWTIQLISLSFSSFKSDNNIHVQNVMFPGGTKGKVHLPMQETKRHAWAWKTPAVWARRSLSRLTLAWRLRTEEARITAHGAVKFTCTNTSVICVHVKWTISAISKYLHWTCGYPESVLFHV